MFNHFFGPQGCVDGANGIRSRTTGPTDTHIIDGFKTKRRFAVCAALIFQTAHAVAAAAGVGGVAAPSAAVDILFGAYASAVFTGLIAAATAFSAGERRSAAVRFI